MIHRATQHVIKKERDRDAAPQRRGARRTAHRLLQLVEHNVRQVMLLRWHTAAACKNTDGGDAIQKFRKKWEMTGMVVFNPPAVEPTLVFFMHATKRARWQRRRDEGTYRRPPYAPPDDRDLPRDTITIYIDGVAGPRRKGEPPPPAGYGCCMVSGGKRMHRRSDVP